MSQISICWGSGKQKESRRNPSLDPGQPGLWSMRIRGLELLRPSHPLTPQGEILEEQGGNHVQQVGEGKTTESSTDRSRQNRLWWYHLNLWLKSAQSQHHQWTFQFCNPVNSPFCLSQFELSFSVFCNWSISDTTRICLFIIEHFLYKRHWAKCGGFCNQWNRHGGDPSGFILCSEGDSTQINTPVKLSVNYKQF